MIPVNLDTFQPSQPSLQIPRGVQKGEDLKPDRRSAKDEAANLNPRSENSKKEEEAVQTETKKEGGRTITKKTKKDGSVEVEVRVEN